MILAVTNLGARRSSASASASLSPSHDARPIRTEATLPPEGVVYHERARVFRRQGSAAAEIASWKGFPLPETYIRDVWDRVDENSQMVESIAEVRTQSGQLLEVTYTTPSGFAVQNVRSGEVRRVPGPGTLPKVDGPDEVSGAAWDEMSSRVNSGSATSQVSTSVNGARSTIFRERRPAPPIPTVTVRTSSGAETSQPATTVPYVGDLQLTSSEKDVSFDESTHSLESSELEGLGADGSTILIESTTWLRRETLPASWWDAIASSPDVTGLR